MKVTHGLRQKLMQLSLTLTAIGVVLLLISLITTFWLRTHSDHLAQQRVPAVGATQRAQIGLQSSLAGLRGWVALGDPRFRSERRVAWSERIEPALADIQLLRDTWPDPADHSRLAELSLGLVELKESQWWVEDVAQTEGNRPASRAVRQRLEPIARALRRVIDALLEDSDSTPAVRATAASFRDELSTAQHALARFVAEGEQQWDRAFAATLSDAEQSLEDATQQAALLPQPQRDRIAYLSRELPWYRHFAEEALSARRSPSWNAALHRMNTETIPLTQQVSTLLDALAASQTSLMDRDTQFITFAGTSAMVVASVLILLMAAIAYALASYRSNQITQPIATLSNATQELADGRLRQDLPITTDDELGTLTNAFNQMRVRLQESEAALLDSNAQLNEANLSLEKHNRFIRDTFGRYLSDDIVDNLLDQPEGLKLGGETRPVTILMSDLRGFTAMAARLAPEQVVAILNRYLGAMAAVIARYQGTIDEFIGDAILVIFGAPVRRADHAESAVACAVAMQLAMDAVNEANRRDGLPELEMGIGVNTGEVVVGNIGSDTRAKYGVVGSAVNLTSRIESYTVGGQVLISDTTRLEVGDSLQVGEKREIAAKGIEPTTIYDLRGIRAPYDLFLPESEEVVVALRDSVPLRFAVLQSKHLDNASMPGTLVGLSSIGGEVLCDRPLAPLSDIKVELLPSGEADSLPEFYAKVTGSLPERAGFSIRFTSVPAELTRWLARLLESSK
ncbi:MAG: adenylate/guanylate cyclase domain-containing protein [Candidatus Palauibacterales bacterium]|nr:adenylate/guanylate cyclase domain-containing protein [Candidatus Palauibacterales bacterium]